MVAELTFVTREARNAVTDADADAIVVFLHFRGSSIAIVAVRHAVASTHGIPDVGTGNRDLHAGALLVGKLTLPGGEFAKLALVAGNALDAMLRYKTDTGNRPPG